MLLLTRTALAQGRSAGWWMSAGIASGLCVHATIAVFGMAYLMGLKGGVTEILRWAAAVYLAYLGSRLLLGSMGAGGKKSLLEEESGADGQSAYLRGLLCNLLNPKVAIIFAAVVTEFVSGADRPVWWAPALWLIIVVQGLVSGCCMSGSFSSLRLGPVTSGPLPGSMRPLELDCLRLDS